MTAITGVLFDLDDTVIDTAASFAAAAGAVAEEFLPQLSPERHGEVLGLWRQDPDGHYQDFVEGRIDYETQRFRRAAQIQAAFDGARLTQESYRRWASVWDETYFRSWRVFEDTMATLASLAEQGIRVGCVTNAPLELQQRKVEATGLVDSLPLLVTLDTFGVGKPDPRLFREAARLLDASPEQTLYIGDEPLTDAVAARDAGLRGVWLDRPGRRRGKEGEDPVWLREQGVAVIESLSEVADLLG